MALDNTKELGKIIGSLKSDQDTIKTNLAPDEEAGSLFIRNTENIKVTGVWTAIKRNYSTTSFIIDHVVYGELDSSTLLLDGGYLQIGGTPVFPAEFPWSFAGGGESSSVIQTITF